MEGGVKVQGMVEEDSMLLQTSKVPVALEPPAFQGLTTKASIVPFQGLTARLCYHCIDIETSPPWPLSHTRSQTMVSVLKEKSLFAKEPICQ